MTAPPKIILIGDLPKAEWCPPFKVLQQLHKKGVVYLIRVPTGAKVHAADLKADALICRPSRGGHLSKELIQEPLHPILVACQSALKIDPPSASNIDPPQAVFF